MSEIKVTVTFKREEADDCDADLSYLTDTRDNYRGLPADEIAKYVDQDLERLAAYRRGDWYMVGIRAVATIWIERPGYRTNYTIKSPGLWGIESDSGEVYLKSIFDDECATLRADIEAMKNAEFKS